MRYFFNQLAQKKILLYRMITFDENRILSFYKIYLEHNAQFICTSSMYTVTTVPRHTIVKKSCIENLDRNMTLLLDARRVARWYVFRPKSKFW
jgi:hypothetical protein